MKIKKSSILGLFLSIFSFSLTFAMKPKNKKKDDAIFSIVVDDDNDLCQYESQKNNIVVIRRKNKKKSAFTEHEDLIAFVKKCLEDYQPESHTPLFVLWNTLAGTGLRGHKNNQSHEKQK